MAQVFIMATFRIMVRWENLESGRDKYGPYHRRLYHVQHQPLWMLYQLLEPCQKLACQCSINQTVVE